MKTMKKTRKLDKKVKKPALKGQYEKPQKNLKRWENSEKPWKISKSDKNHERSRKIDILRKKWKKWQKSAKNHLKQMVLGGGAPNIN